MLLSGWEVYGILMLNSVLGVCSFLLAFTIVTIVGFLMHMSDYGDDDGNGKKWLKRLAAIGVTLLLVLVVTPTTKQAAVIYLLPKIVNNTNVQALPTNALRLLNSKMEAYINEQVLIGKKEENKI